MALAVSTMVFAGVGITRENDTVSERADFLDKPTVIENFRKAGITKSDKDKIPPLVTEAIAFALRIDPPEVIRTTPTKDPKDKTDKTIPNVLTKIAKAITRTSTFKLVATCRYEKFPEKSLALLDITSKGLVWVQQGDMLGSYDIHQINDGSIELLQGKISSIINVPKKNPIRSLLKGSGDTITTTVSPVNITRTTYKPVNQGTLSQPRDPRRVRHKTNLNPRSHIRPPKKLSEEARKALDKDAKEITGILEGLDTSRKTGSGAKDSDKEALKAILKLLEKKPKE